MARERTAAEEAHALGLMLSAGYVRLQQCFTELQMRDLVLYVAPLQGASHGVVLLAERSTLMDSKVNMQRAIAGGKAMLCAPLHLTLMLEKPVEIKGLMP